MMRFIQLLDDVDSAADEPLGLSISLGYSFQRPAKIVRAAVRWGNAVLRRFLDERRRLRATRRQRGHRHFTVTES
jgi:hypothetical protein